MRIPAEFSARCEIVGPGENLRRSKWSLARPTESHSFPKEFGANILKFKKEKVDDGVKCCHLHVFIRPEVDGS